MATTPFDFDPAKATIEEQSLLLRQRTAFANDLSQGANNLMRDFETIAARITAVGVAAGIKEDGTVVTPAPTPTDPNAEPPMEGAVYRNGAFDIDSYQALALAGGTAAQTAYMSGPTAAYWGFDKVQMPPLLKRPDRSLDVVGEFRNPGVYGARAGKPGQLGTFQTGEARADQAGNYSSTYGQVLHEPYNRAAPKGEGGIGVSGLMGLSVGYDAFGTRPEPAWWSFLQEYGGIGDVDDINQYKYRDQGKKIEFPTFLASGDGRFGEGTSSAVGYRDGLITFSGQNTASNLASLQLPTGLVPIEGVISNSHEALFVLVMNKQLNRTQLAVILLASTPQGGYAGNEANWIPFRGEWRSILPGVGGHGNIGWCKFIGVVDLPAEMRCATSIACSTWTWEGAYARMSEEVNGQYGSDMRQSKWRAEFRDGGRRAGSFPTSCTVVVGSKEERMAVGLDFSKLFQFIRSSTIEEPGLQNVGLGAGQYPPTFAERPSILPSVIWKETFQGRVTAVQCSHVDINRRIYITEQQGRLNAYSAGADRTPSDLTIAKLFTLPVGKNVTCIGRTSRKAGGNPKILGYGQQSREIHLTSRGERKIQWVRLSEDYKSGYIIRQASAASLIDPIHASDNPNHTTESGILSVSDYGGGQVMNLIYSNLITHWWEGEMGDAGTSPPLRFSWIYHRPPDGQPVVGTTFNGVFHPFDIGGTWTTKGRPRCYYPRDVF